MTGSERPIHHSVGFSAKVTRARRFPLPEQPVIRDMPVLEGRAAEVRSPRVLAVCLGLTGAGFWLMLWRLVGTLGGHAS